jgi:hypothetical protein
LQQSSQERLNKTFTPHDHQSAFRKGHSTLDPLLAFTALEKQPADGLRTHTFFLDMQKAYDKVWHAGLFWKLHKNGITGKLWRIIHELYANSASTPIIEGQTTELYRIEQGVAQGCPMSLHCSTCSLMMQTTFRRNATMTASPYRPHSIAS